MELILDSCAIVTIFCLKTVALCLFAYSLSRKASGLRVRKYLASALILYGVYVLFGAQGGYIDLIKGVVLAGLVGALFCRRAFCGGPGIAFAISAGFCLLCAAADASVPRLLDRALPGRQTVDQLTRRIVDKYTRAVAKNPHLAPSGTLGEALRRLPGQMLFAAGAGLSGSDLFAPIKTATATVKEAKRLQVVGAERVALIDSIIDSGGTGPTPAPTAVVTHLHANEETGAATNDPSVGSFTDAPAIALTNRHAATAGAAAASKPLGGGGATSNALSAVQPPHPHVSSPATSRTEVATATVPGSVAAPPPDVRGPAGSTGVLVAGAGFVVVMTPRDQARMQSLAVDQRQEWLAAARQINVTGKMTTAGGAVVFVNRKLYRRGQILAVAQPSAERSFRLLSVDPRGVSRWEPVLDEATGTTAIVNF